MAHLAPASAFEIRQSLHQRAQSLCRGDNEAALLQLATQAGFHAMLAEACRPCLLEASVFFDASRCARLFLRWGVKERRDANSRSLLALARDFNHLATAQALLESGIDPDDLGPPDLTISAKGARQVVSLGSPEFTRLRMSFGADPNYRGARADQSPLIFHARDKASALALLEAGADPDALGLGGRRASERHRERGAVEIAELIEAFSERALLAGLSRPAPPTAKEARL